MKTLRKLCYIALFFCISIVAFLTAGFFSGQSRPLVPDGGEDVLQPKVWTETSVQDFADGQFEDVILTDFSGGELRLPEPMRKIVDDHQDNSVPRFASYDTNGNYVTVWAKGDAIYVELHNAQGEILSGPVRANDEGSFGGNRIPAAAMGDEGYIVVWDDIRESEFGSDENVYAQLYDNSGAVIGNNFRVNDQTVTMQNDPVPFVDAHGNYWIVWGRGQFYAQKYTSSGEPVDSNFVFPNQQMTQFESSPAAEVGQNGKMVVAWVGSNTISSDDTDIYVQRFTSDGDPIGEASKVNDDAGLHWQLLPDVALNAQGHFMVVWGDERRGDYRHMDVMGQYFDLNGVAVGENFIVKYDAGYAPMADVTSNQQEEFQVSWDYLWADEPNIWVNLWTYVAIHSGAYRSSVFDTGPSGSRFEAITWNAEMNQDVDLSFQIRTAEVLALLEGTPWSGPTDTTDYYHISSGQNINPVHDDHRYVQYRTLFSASQAGMTPNLKEVSITYFPSDSIAPAKVQGLISSAGHSVISLTWTPNSESDLSSYRVYRGMRSRDYDTMWTVAKLASTFSDSSVVTGTPYFYAVTAVDSNFNESLFSDEVSTTPFGIVFHINASAPQGGNGSYERPFSEIQRGIEAGIFGDTILVAEGIYEENLLMTDGITLIGSGAEVCEVKTKTSKPTITCGDRCTVKGFTIHQTLGNPYGANIYAESTCVLISDNIIIGLGKSSPGCCIWCSSGGYAAKGKHAYILKNIITNTDRGIICNGAYHEDASPTISNNLIHSIKGGINIERNDSVRITNNTIYIEEVSYGEGIEGHGNKTLDIMGNIVFNRVNTWGGGIEHRDDMYPAACNVAYNDVWVNNVPFDGFEPGEGNISADPLFRDVERGDFRLADDSPCRDAGPPDSQFNDPDGSRNDMGAYGGPDPLTLGVQHPRVCVSIEPVSAFAGDTCTVPIYIDNAAGLATIEAEIESDASILLPVGVSTGELMEGFDIRTEITSSRMIHLHIDGQAEVSGGDGCIAQLIYQVKPDAQPHEACPLRFQRLDLLDGSGIAIKTKSITHGVFIVKEKHESGPYIFVDQQNQGQEFGTWDMPFSTISEAIEAAFHSDTILVAAGIYHERIVLKDGITLRGSGPLATKLDYAIEEFGESEETMLFEDVSHSEISGFEIGFQGQGSMPTAIRCIRSNVTIRDNRILIPPTDVGAGIICEDTSTATIQGNGIVAEMLSGTAIACLSSNAQIQSNSIDILGGGTGILLSSSTGRILSNRILLEYPLALGITASESHALIANNSIEGEGHHSGIGVASSDSVMILNNVICHNMTGIDLTADGVAVIKNNIILDHIEHMGKGIWNRDNWDTDISYNDFWNNTTDLTGVSAGLDNLYEDPAFMDAEIRDFHLRSDSPCIDTGDPDPRYNDLDGTRNDMGIFGGPYALPENSPFRMPVRVSLSDTSAAPGDTVEVVVRLEKAMGTAEVSMILSYPSDTLSIVDAQTTCYSRSFSLTTEDMGPGRIKISLSGSKGIQTENCAIARLFIEVLRFAPEGAKGDIQPSDVLLRDELAMTLRVGQITGSTIDIGAKTDVNEDTHVQNIPSHPALLQNYPNPFNPITDIKYQIPDTRYPTHTTLTIFNVLGQEVKILVDEMQEAGQYTVTWDGRDRLGSEVASGVYFFQLKAGRFIQTKKMVLLQ